MGCTGKCSTFYLFASTVYCLPLYVLGWKNATVETITSSVEKNPTTTIYIKFLEADFQVDIRLKQCTPLVTTCGSIPGMQVTHIYVLEFKCNKFDI